MGELLAPMWTIAAALLFLSFVSLASLWLEWGKLSKRNKKNRDLIQNDEEYQEDASS